MPYLNHVANIGDATNPANAGSIAVVTTQTVPVGGVIVGRGSSYQEGLSGGPSNKHSGIVDPHAHGWNKLGEVTGVDGSINVIVSLWLLVVTTEIASGSTITLNISENERGRAFALEYFDKGILANGINIVDTNVDYGNGNVLSVSLTVPAAEITWLGAGAHAEAQTTVTLDGAFTTDRAKLVVNGGTSFGNTSLWGQFRQFENDTDTLNASLSTISRAWGMILTAIEITEPPPPPSDPGERQFQEDFETGTQHNLGTSTTRRPDAVSVDYLTAFSMGPIGVENVSQGVEARRWKARATHDGVDNGQVYLSRGNAANNTWEDETLLFEYEGVPIVEMDLAFTLEGSPVIVASRLSGTLAAEHVWQYWLDSIYPGYFFTDRGVGRTPRCALDLFPFVGAAHICPPEVDVQVVYLKPGTGLVRLEQRDRYTVEYGSPLGYSANRFLEEFFPSSLGRRMVIAYSERNPVLGTYSIKFLYSVPYDDSLLRRPLFANWSDVGHDFYRSGDGLWRVSAGSDDQYVRVEVQDDCDGIECEGAADFPAGITPAFGQQPQVATGPFTAGDARDFTFAMTYGGGTLSIVAVRARCYKVIGDVTCYSPYRYFILPMAWPTEDALGNPEDSVENCDRDTFINVPGRNIWARGGTVEWTRTRLTSAHDDPPFVCPDEATSPPPDWVLAGGIWNFGGVDYPAVTHRPSYGVRRRPIEVVDFTDEDGFRFVGGVLGAVMESAGGGTPPAYGTPSTRTPLQFPENTGEFG